MLEMLRRRWWVVALRRGAAILFVAAFQLRKEMRRELLLYRHAPAAG